MIDHVTLKVTDLQQSRRFYQATLQPLGYVIAMEFPQAVGFAVDGKPDFWIATGPVCPTHVAFAAKDRASVDAFFRAAVAAGGKDNGRPGLRAHYHPQYFGAFVLDPDGHNVEAVCHRTE
jgi:catechol 2,3-dioxygenase-like lactoylglutathione lyase family enzyme